MNSGAMNPPGGVNLTIAIFALIGATLSIVGFFAHYVPHHQYADFCDIMKDIHSAFVDNNWQRPSDERLWRHYRSVSENMERFHYLVTTPWYLSTFHVSTAWRLSSLRESASRLKIELIALSQIQRSKELQQFMETSLSSTTTPTNMQSSDALSTNNTTAYTQNAGVELLAPDTPSSRWWCRWSKAPQATTRRVVDDCERLAV